MTWRTVVSVVAFLAMYYHAWRMETYFGWCGTPVVEWQFNATLAGLVGSAIAIRPLIRAWREPGRPFAVARIVYLTVIVGFAVFLFRFYVYPNLGMSNTA
jgi:hypothetical protein